MDLMVKDAAVYMRKYFLFSLESAYKFACGHPFVSSFVFSLFLLHSCYPFLFAFLVSSSPVLICTALLLGILLCHGEPNIPEIEEDDKLNQKVSSLKVENYLDDLIVKKDKSYTLEDHVGTKGRTSKDSATNYENERMGDFFAVSSLVEEQNKNVEDYFLEHGFVENGGGLMKEQSECDVGMSEVVDGGSEGVEGLSLTISRAEPDDCLDSSLGSPWQHIHILDAASVSESDEAESSSTDASMTDILPMLNELHPLLDLKAPKSVDNSDAELSQHHESDEDSVEQEDELRIEESGASNKIVTWTADDQKNVMDLGSSDLERNRRLESLIARRRARKNQIIIFEQDLIDLHSNDKAVDELFRFHPQIPPISAPRRNPFDLHHESDASEGYPPIPGSAPSVLVHRQNPFDFLCDSENGSKGLAGDNLCQPEFEPPSRRGISFRGHGSFSSRSLFPSNVIHEKHGSSSSSRLKHCVAGETMCLESNEHFDPDTMSSAIDPEHQKELAEQEMYEYTDLPVSMHDTITTVQDDQSYIGDLVGFEAELVVDGHFVDPNFSAFTEETHRSIDASVFFKEELERTRLIFDGQKNEVSDEKDYEWTLFTSSEDKEKSLHISPHEALPTQGQITSFSEETSESVQSSDACSSLLFSEAERVHNSQAAFPIYDSSTSGSGNFIVNIYVPDDTLLSSGRGGPNSTSVEPHVQEDVTEVVCHARAFEENMSSEMMEFEMVHGSKLQNSTSSSEPLTPSTYISLLDEDILTTKGISGTGAHGFTDNRSQGIDEGFGVLATSVEIDHSSGFSSTKADLNETGFAFSAGFHTSNVEEKHQLLEKLELQTPFGNDNFESGPILEENSEDFILKEEQVSLFMPTVMSSTGPQVLEEISVCNSSVGREVIPLHSQSEEAAGDEGNEKGIDFSPKNAQPSKASNLASANDDRFSGLLVGELLDSTEFSNFYKMKSEYEFTSNDDINDSQASDINQFQISQDVILRNLNEFYAEPGDVDTEVREIQCFDERLLSELDAVGDFQVGFESQQCLQIELQSASQLDYSNEASGLGSPGIADTSPKNTTSANQNSPYEMDLVLNKKETTESGFFSLAMTPVEDLELTVYKPKFNVLQAYSIEELDSTFKQDFPGEFAEPYLSETITDNFVAEKPHVGLSMSDQEIEARPHEVTVFTPHKKIIEDISPDLIGDGRDFRNLSPAYFYFQHNDNHSSIDGCKAKIIIVDACEYDPTETQSSEVKAVHVETAIPSTRSLTSYVSAVHEAGASSTELNISSRDLERGGKDSELVVEANTIEDTNSSFKHASHFILNKSISPPVNPEPMITHPVDNVVEAMSHEVEKTSGLLFLEAKSVEDLNSAFKEATKEALSMPVFCSSDPDSSWTHTNFEKMELNSSGNASELFVLEEKSAEDIQLGFKQAIEGVSTVPTLPLVDPNLIRAAQGLPVVEAVYPYVQNDSELLLPGGKPSEDINSVLKQFDIEKMASHSNVKLEADDTGPFNAENDTEPLPLGKKFVNVTSTFQQATDQVFDKSAFHQGHTMSLGSEANDEVVDVYSLETQIDPELSVLTAKSAKYININSALEQDNEGYPAHSTSQDDPELRYFHPGHDVMEKKSLWVEDRSEILALELKSFEGTNLDFKEAAADFFRPSTTLVDPEHDLGQIVLAEKSPDSCNNSHFLVAEAKSLEDLNLTFEQTAKDCHVKHTPKDDTDYAEVEENFVAHDNYFELVVVEEKSFVNIQSAFTEATIGDCEVSSSFPADPKPIETLRGEKDNNMCFEAENNSEILVIEAKSFDDINSAFKLATSVPSSPLLTDARSFDTETESNLLVFEEISDILTDSALAQVHEEGSTKPIFSIDPPALLVNENDEFMEDNSLGKNDLELLVIEENSAKDIDSALEQVSGEYIGRPVTLQDDSKPETRSEIQQKDPELSILQPMSVGDSNVIVKQVSEEGDKKTASSENEEGSTEGKNHEMDEHGFATTGVDIRELQHDVEVDARETIVVSDEIVILKSRTIEDQMNIRNAEVEVLSAEKEESVNEVPGSMAPTLLNIKKKGKKSDKSDSSSSSSPSSSDSE